MEHSTPNRVVKNSAKTIYIDHPETSYGIFAYNSIGDLFLSSDWGFYGFSWRSYGDNFESFLKQCNADYITDKFATTWNQNSKAQFNGRRAKSVHTLVEMFLVELRKYDSVKSDFVEIVGEFHTVFKHPILKSPTIPKDRVELRMSLLREELKELQEAIDNNDLCEVADAFCDLQYVLSGAILEFGFAKHFEALFRETHRSNMSKACTSLEEAEKTIEHHTAKGEECYFKKDGEHWLVYRTSDNKTLKSINYSPVNLKAILGL